MLGRRLLGRIVGFSLRLTFLRFTFSRLCGSASSATLRPLRQVFPGSPRRKRGQVLVIAAVLLPVILLLFLFALGFMAMQDVRAHAEYALDVATRAGARRIEYAGQGQGGPAFSADVEADVKAVFQDALSLRPTGLVGTPEDIAETVEVALGGGRPGAPWVSPYTGREHLHLTVAARVPLPVRVWRLELTLNIISETEVR